jgi:hypothetical protein
VSTDVVTHRIVGLKNGLIQTEDDANRNADTRNIRPDQVKGVVVHELPDVGYVVDFLKRRTGDAAVAIGLLAIILLWDLFFAASAKPEGPRVG